MALNPAVASMEAKSTETDPGAVDNRLTLDPGDKRWSGLLKKWEDGEDYSITVKARQISPGEFEVMSLKAKATPTDEPPEPAEEDDDDDDKPAPRKRGKVNKAVREMAYD